MTEQNKKGKSKERIRNIYKKSIREWKANTKNKELIKKIVDEMFVFKPITSPRINIAREKACERGEIAKNPINLKDKNGNPIPEEMYYCISGCGYVKGKPYKVYGASKHCFGAGNVKLCCRICNQPLIPLSMLSSVGQS